MNYILNFGKDKMKSYLEALGYDVWYFVISGDTSTDELRSNNSKSMNVILSALPDSMKAKVDQCSTTKHLWEKLQSICLKKHVGQDNDVDHDSNREDIRVKESDNDEE